MLTLVSLFDGIGGFPLAFERVGARTVATVEIDETAAAISARHFPHATQFRDVTEVSGDDLRSAGFVPDRGVLTAGWPCQDFSVAGRRAGLAGARSGLWWEVVRLLAETGARWFVGENVPGLLSSVCEPECPGGCMQSHGGAMGAVLGSLADLGYGFAYRVLDAQHFGVPQQRRRVFIVGHLGASIGAAAEILFEPESSERDSATGEQTWSDVADGAAQGSGEAVRDVATTVVARIGKGTPDSGVSDSLLLDGSDHTHTHSGSGVDAAGRRETWLPGRRRSGSGRSAHRREVVSALTTSCCGGIGGVDDNAAQAGYVVAQSVTVTGGVTHTLTSEGADASEDGTGRGTSVVVQPLALRGRDGGTQLEIGAEGGPYNALRAGDGGSSRQSLIAVTALDLRNCARYTEAGETAGTGIREGGPSYGVNATRRALPGVAHETIVRRLTELECERLQGYPDGWTEGQSGSARYRQLGNSVAVPVVEWIARRLVAVDHELFAEVPV